MKAVNKFIVAEEVHREIKTGSGLVMSSKDAEDIRYRECKVVSVGNEVVAIKEGDSVLYDRNAGFKLMIEGRPYLVILERDVVVVL